MANDPPELPAPDYGQVSSGFGPSESVEIDRGAIYRPLHVEREVKIYPIQEHELKTIGLFNAGFTICCSISAATLTFVAGIVWDTSVAQNSEASAVGTGALVLCGLVITASVFAAFWLRRGRQSELEKILGEVKR